VSKLSNTVTCKWCGTTSTLGACDIYSDVTICKGTALKRCGKAIPTGLEKEVRKVEEAWAGGENLKYPKVAVARAIGFAAGIYKLATDGRGIRYQDVDQQVARNFSTAPAATSKELGTIKRELKVEPTKVGWNSEAKIVTDLGVGVVVVAVHGQAADRRPWAQVYVVFRGSRGEGQDTNRNLAGWANFADMGAQAEMHCIDWQQNFKSKQVSPWWDSSVKVHQGFYDLYSGCMRQIEGQVRELYASYSRLRPQVIVCGHSLGAALATLCAHHLSSETPFEPFCFTFNSPRAGNLQFVRDFKENISRKKKVLYSEPAAGDYFRAFAFQRDNDMVSKGVEHGVRRDAQVSAADAQWDRGRFTMTGPKLGMVTQKKAIDDAGLSETAIFYHIQNRVKMREWRAAWNAHNFNLMEEELMGSSVSDRQ
jgi:pimeloyl-ACP methyl ester carboxylesterase